VNNYFAYIRVSTTRQGEHGVSLQQQREAIERYARKNDLEISQWFEEQQTAARRGRPQFTQMLRLLQKRKARGVIIHKIDRSARNLRDWADLGELIDSGIIIHFASESLDLTSRGGRLSADLQAVVAADFIRNLREETKKGFYGRLKQGFYPMRAPLGYLDAGSGKMKLIDPVRGPLIKRAFELYATGKYSQVSLGEELYRLGLRGRNGTQLDKNFLGRMLNNRFYMGIIDIKKANETFLGAHPPLVSKKLFDEVQRVCSGNFSGVKRKHDFLFRQLFWCKLCRRSLIAESHKGHTYYRCQKKTCLTRSIREEPIENALAEKLHEIHLNIEQHAYLRRKFDEFRGHWAENQTKAIDSLKIQLSLAKDKLNRLTDAYLDGALDRDIFEQRKTALLLERRDLEDRIESVKKADSTRTPLKLERLLELTENPYSLYMSSLSDEKRELIQDVSSNRSLCEKQLEISLSIPFAEVAKCIQITAGSPPRANARIWDRLAEFLFNFFQPSQDVKV
jgi:site-specific DNA recombinase